MVQSYLFSTFMLPLWANLSPSSKRGWWQQTSVLEFMTVIMKAQISTSMTMEELGLWCMPVISVLGRWRQADHWSMTSCQSRKFFVFICLFFLAPGVQRERGSVCKTKWEVPGEWVRRKRAITGLSGNGAQLPTSTSGCSQLPATPVPWNSASSPGLHSTPHTHTHTHVVHTQTWK